MKVQAIGSVAPKQNVAFSFVLTPMGTNNAKLFVF